MRLLDTSGAEVRLYYDFDKMDSVADSVRIISTLEGKWLKIRFDPECGMALSFEATTEPSARPAAQTRTPRRQLPRRKPSPRLGRRPE